MEICQPGPFAQKLKRYPVNFGSTARVLQLREKPNSRFHDLNIYPHRNVSASSQAVNHLSGRYHIGAQMYR
jgi:hypothetical protein